MGLPAEKGVFTADLKGSQLDRKGAQGFGFRFSACSPGDQARLFEASFKPDGAVWRIGPDGRVGRICEIRFRLILDRQGTGSLKRDFPV